jgi:hypothetical protein
MDGRFTQAVAAVDPRWGRMTIWTQHTVAGGAGSKVNWLQIDTGNSTTPVRIVQMGAASDPTLYAFNGAISPDRVFRTSASGTTAQFGSNMVLGFNTSSRTTITAIRMISKMGDNTQSTFRLVRQSLGKNEDFTCSPVCRWGDYAGASPDPMMSATGPSGRIWLTSQWNVASSDPVNIDWTTWNWAANP